MRRRPNIWLQTALNPSLKIFRILSKRYRNRRRRYSLRCNLIATLYNDELSLAA